MRAERATCALDPLIVSLWRRPTCGRSLGWSSGWSSGWSLVGVHGLLPWAAHRAAGWGCSLCCSLHCSRGVSPWVPPKAGPWAAP
eukprot:5397641-Alexandrium_andersonii.AAC.1